MADTDQASELLDLYEQMVVIRLTEQATHDLFLSVVKGTPPRRRSRGGRRGGGAALRGRLRVRHMSRPPLRWRGATAEECLSELMSKATGCAGPRAGPCT